MKKQFLFLASLRFLKIAFSAGAVILYARYFGIGFEMDSWVWASGITASIGLMLWGPVNETIRSRFVRLMSESGQAVALSNARSVLLFTTAVSLLVAAVIYFGLPQIIGSLYPTSTPAQSRLLSEIILLMLPSIVIGQVLNLGIAYMNCHDIIYTPEVMGIFSSALNLLCVPLLSPRLGVYSLVVGHYLGILVSLIVVTHFLYVRKVMRGPLHPLVVWQDSKAAIIFAAPLFLSYGAGQMNGLLEKFIGSLLGVGVVSSVNYASQIKSTLQAVLASVLFSLVVPRLTQAASSSDETQFTRMLRDSQRTALICLFFLLPFVFGAAEPIALLLFGKAVSSPAALAEMSTLIRLYVAALLGVVLYLVYGVALLAQQKGKVYAVYGVGSQLASAAFTILLYKILGSSVFAYALLVSHLGAALLMLRHIESSNRRDILEDASKFFLIISLFAALIYAAHEISRVFLSTPAQSLACLVIVNITLLLMLYFFKGIKAFIHAKSITRCRK